MFNHLTNIHLYEGCGNRLIIVHLQKRFSRKDPRLRSELQKIGLEHDADSVLVVTGDPYKCLEQGYHLTMDVFEPRGTDVKHPKLSGSWSTMCGNGIRAVSRYLMDSESMACYIKTRSGVLATNILAHNQFRVCMGKFTTELKQIQKYVRRFSFNNLLHDRFLFSEIVVGLNGHPNVHGSIDGEPHAIVFLKDYDNLTLSSLMEMANRCGLEITTNREYFPKCINTNFVLIKTRSEQTISVLACTFERGVEYVTQACGTGATAIGSYLLSKDRRLEVIKVIMPGGELLISRAPDRQYYLTGPANPIEIERSTL